MTVLVWSIAVLQVLVPCALILWVWRRRPATRLEWVTGVAAGASAFAVLAIVLPWSVVPWWMRRVYAVAGLVVVSISVVRSRRRPSVNMPGRRQLMAVGTQMALTVFFGGALIAAVTGMTAPGEPAIDLACPLGTGSYLVVNGGNSLLLNSHLETLDTAARYMPWRGQSYGIDVVQLDAWGRRSDGVLPPEPARYRIFGQVVLAPCSGRVVSVANDRPDMPVPQPDPDRARLAGNHVLIDCQGAEVLLAHLQRGSVVVAPGEQVTTAQRLGLVGNSGNTTEPHLHVSAQRRQAGESLIGGAPVWLTVNGRYLVRNDRLVCGGPGLTRE